MKFLRWFEIPVKNLARAKAFYIDVFQVDFHQEMIEEALIAFFKLSGEDQVRGALCEVHGDIGVSNGPILFFDANIDMLGMLETIEERGGKVLVPKTMIKNVTKEGKTVIAKTFIDNNTGYYAYFLDSEGNKMGLYSNS